MSRERGVDIEKRERERVREEGRGGIESERVKRERYWRVVGMSIEPDGENLFWAEKLENSFVSLANNGKNIFPIF